MVFQAQRHAYTWHVNLSGTPSGSNPFKPLPLTENVHIILEHPPPPMKLSALFFVLASVAATLAAPTVGSIQYPTNPKRDADRLFVRFYRSWKGMPVYVAPYITSIACTNWAVSTRTLTGNAASRTNPQDGERMRDGVFLLHQFSFL